ncbi:ribosomal RNA-processing protein 7 homolog A-like [Convolutriloba macropyga]|uniref:ribosomal RNA-processing protein 7 homolog A-like n=1 Tax=Convolutriloba macropyga TaxID=536237 RepID=UPI003F528DF4
MSDGEKRVPFQLQFVNGKPKSFQKRSGSKLFSLEAELCKTVPELPLTYEFCNTAVQFESALKILNVPFFIDENLLYTALKSAKDFITTGSKLDRDLNLAETKFSYANHCFKIFADTSDMTRRTKFVVFQHEVGATECLRFLKSVGNSCTNHLTFNERELEGVNFYCNQYMEQFPTDPASLNREVSNWLQKFAQEEEEEKLGKKDEVNRMREGVNKPVGDGEKDDDGDGWTVVSRHGKRKIKQGGLAFTQENQIKALKMRERRSNEKQVLNFYAHHLQTKKQKAEKELRERFERDKLIVARMKSSNRKFNPGPK